ncbi:hypothetical protein Ae201684P_017197 [Aphanomyces euteiches]|nr:hypothetical protein Ae201684P_017197 [Aphanomyces euteiches]
MGGGGGEQMDIGSAECSMKGSFLGVGNAECIGAHLGYAAFLCAIMILLSFVLDILIKQLRQAVKCPQMMRVVNRFFEELMVMGCIFAINTSGGLNQLSFVVSGLSQVQLLHFQEFFHYVVFMTAVYYICIMLLLILIATVVPRLLYDRQKATQNPADDDLELSPSNNLSSYTNRTSVRRIQRQASGYDFVNGSRMYFLLRQRYKREGWSFQFNLVKQFVLWKSFEVLAYNVCQYRSGYLYKNPAEMQRIFGLSYHSSHHVDFARFNTLCTRNMLATVTQLHYSAFIILISLVMASGLLGEMSAYLYIGTAAALCAINFVIMIKTLRILKGIIKDRLRILTMQDIERMVPPLSTALLTPPRHKKSRRASRASDSAHANVSAVSSPRFLLRLFQFATTGQAFYLVWLTLVIAQDKSIASWMYFLMALFPLISMFVITPLTMPSLVLVMSLTGFFVEQNPHRPQDQETLTIKDRIRVARRSYLRSTDDISDMVVSPTQSPSNSDMFLHMYDVAASPSRRPIEGSPRDISKIRPSSVPSSAPPSVPPSPPRTFKLFEKYCSSYGGYPDEETEGRTAREV